MWVLGREVVLRRKEDWGSRSAPSAYVRQLVRKRLEGCAPSKGTESDHPRPERVLLVCVGSNNGSVYRYLKRVVLKLDAKRDPLARRCITRKASERLESIVVPPHRDLASRQTDFVAKELIGTLARILNIEDEAGCYSGAGRWS